MKILSIPNLKIFFSWIALSRIVEEAICSQPLIFCVSLPHWIGTAKINLLISLRLQYLLSFFKLTYRVTCLLNTLLISLLISYIFTEIHFLVNLFTTLTSSQPILGWFIWLFRLKWLVLYVKRLPIVIDWLLNSLMLREISR